MILAQQSTKIRHWKKNFRRIPDWIAVKVKHFEKKEISVSCVKRITESAIADGIYSQIGVIYQEGKLIFPKKIIPNYMAGHYSDCNMHGRDIVRKDLPMETRVYSWEAPNYGDWGKGSHECSFNREVHHRDFIPPRELELLVEMIGKEAGGEQTTYVFKFTINSILDRTSSDFIDDLFFALNLMQENVGTVDVYPSNASLDDYLKTLYVDWEILPPGEREETIAKILSGFKAPTKEIREKIIARYDLLARLKPIGWVSGTSGFRRYFGAKFSDDLVAFENLEYGNAIYVMFKNWQALSKLSRIELLTQKQRDDFCRIVHASNWQIKLKRIIKKRLNDQKHQNMVREN